MSTNTKNVSLTKRITFIAMMAAIVCVVTLFRFPFLGSKVHFANTMCLLSGLLFGPLWGGVAAGLGSCLYDLLLGGYEIGEALITFTTKFAMAAVCALVAGRTVEKRGVIRVILAAVIGALSYVVMYLFKTWCMQSFVYGYAQDAVWATVASKAPASLINALLASVAAPVIYGALIKPIRALDLPW